MAIWYIGMRSFIGTVGQGLFAEEINTDDSRKL